jgi:mRNA-degrading endonuclease toxin of MazEF toxin-antitoxin module
MEKDYSLWFQLKPKLNRKAPPQAYVSEGEIWWCSIGTNIDIEIDGKNEDCERPVLVLKTFNLHHVLIVPIKGKEISDKFHVLFIMNEAPSCCVLTQLRCASTKRLLRKMAILDPEKFKEVREKIKRML